MKQNDRSLIFSVNHMLHDLRASSRLLHKTFKPKCTNIPSMIARILALLFLLGAWQLTASRPRRSLFRLRCRDRHVRSLRRHQRLPGRTALTGSSEASRAAIPTASLSDQQRGLISSLTAISATRSTPAKSRRTGQPAPLPRPRHLYCNDVYGEACRRNIEVHSVRVEVTGEFGAQGEGARNIAHIVSIKCSASQEDLLALMRHTDTVAEIQNTLRSSVSVTLAHCDANTTSPE